MDKMESRYKAFSSKSKKAGSVTHGQKKNHMYVYSPINNANSHIKKNKGSRRPFIW